MQTKRSSTFRLGPHHTGSWIVGLAALLTSAAAPAAEDRRGEQVYRQMCASCHGAAGEGVPEEYPRPLVGDRTVAQLTTFIAKTMPEDDPGTCVGPDAEKVAAYIHEAFYSRAAQARTAPARIELAHLTVRQYRNAVADLVGSFRDPLKRDGRHGLHAEYYRSRRFRTSDRVIDRIDPVVRFDFGEESPDSDKMEAEQFSIRWEGSVLAPETGEVEFVVRTEHATRLWVNDANRPLIDAWVKSGNDTEFRGSIYLLAGRAYPIRLEFSKAKQGVADSKNPKPPPVKASIALEWKPPHRRPRRSFPSTTCRPAPPPRRSSCRLPSRPTTAALVTSAGRRSPKPGSGPRPTPRSRSRPTSPTTSASWRASNDGPIGGHAAPRFLPPLRRTRVSPAAHRRAETAFHRPPVRRREGHGDRHQARGAARPQITAVPVSRDRHGAPDAYDVASRLSFGLWDSLPDKELLLDAAAAHRLTTREQVRRQAERMLADPRARAKLGEFFLQWLKVEVAPDLSKNRKQFPGFDQAVASDLRTSLELFLDDVVWSEAADFRQLLCAEHVYLNGRLARFYGSNLPADAPFQKVSLGAGKRSGVLSHPYVMATFAYTDATSPIHRGVFLARSLLGQSLRPPPVAVAPLAPDLHPGLTTRERVLMQTKPQTCQSCHAVINPLGFTLEHFDAVGRYRDKERGRPINATGTYQTRSGAPVKLTGVRDLAKFLAGSEEVHEAFVEQMFHHVVRQPIRAYGARQLPELRLR